MEKQPFTYLGFYTHHQKESMAIKLAGYVYRIDEVLDNSNEHKQLIEQGYTREGIYKIDDAFINKTKGVVEL